MIEFSGELEGVGDGSFDDGEPKRHDGRLVLFCLGLLGIWGRWCFFLILGMEDCKHVLYIVEHAGYC